MRKFFTRLLLMVTLLSVISLVSVAQSWTSPKLTPVDGACTVLKTGQIFTIDFGEAVMPVKGGKISLNASNGTQMYPIQFNWDGTNPPAPWVYTSSIAPYGTVTFSGNQVVIDFKATLTEKADYYITVHPGSIKRVSTGLTNTGDWGTVPGTGTLTCNDDAGFKWDFTVGDFTAPSVALFRPLDEAKDVDPAFILSKGIKIKFNENMAWAPGKNLASLAPGDIALYTTTDPVLGQYGGDVIFLKPSNVVIAADSIVIYWPGTIPSLTNMYVRIKSGLFAEVQTCPSCPGQTAPKLWGGINTNGTGANGVPNSAVPWNFTTKDTRAPKLTFKRDDCTDISNFYIEIDEANIVTANAMVPVNNTNIDAFVTFSGGAFDATVIKESNKTTIKIDPVNKLVSGAITTVALLPGLWDSSQNPVPAGQNSWTNGDYLAPVFSKLQSTNQVGTSFDILANVNEKTTIYYIVVKKSDVLKSGVEFYKPTMKQVVDSLGAFWNAHGDPDNVNIPAADIYGDLAFPLDSYLFVKPAPNAEKKQVKIWAAGAFNINNTGVDVLERVLDLPRTHGMDYIVYAYAFDYSDCGVYNWENLSAVTKGYATGLLSFPASTVDVLPPVPTISAATVNNQWCDQGHTVKAIKRNGPLYVTFNEGIRLANGTDITPASLEDIFELRDNGTLVGINTATSFYSAADKKITIYPDSAFKSGSTVTLKLLSNKIEDLFGIERNVPVTKDFCVENYCEPLISWTADKWNNQLNKPLHDLDTEVEEAGTIRVVFNQKVYAPADNESPAGALTQIVNTPGLINSVSNFIKIGESTTSGGPFTIIYENGNLVNFDVTINDYSGDSTVITIKPKSPYVFGSEMWYNIEVEGTLQNVERYTLNSGMCYDQATDITFQVTDHQPPTVLFFEGNQSSQTMYRQLNNCVSCNTPTLDVNKNYRIGVSISEWISLGFDGMPNVLEPSETIKDANAMRRYFSLTKCDGTPIKFDVEDFSIDAGLDMAYMFIDPYDYPTAGTESPNFVPGETYTVKFISNAQEVDYGPGAFADDHGNLIEPAEACFKIFTEPVPVVCFSNIVKGLQATGACPGIVPNETTFSVALNFNKAMQFNAGSNPAVRIYAANKTDVVFGTNFANLAISNDAKTFTMNDANNNDEGNPALFVDKQKYYIAVYKEVFKAIDSGIDCKWPAVSSKAVLNIGNWVIVDSLWTVDATPPTLVSKTTGVIAKTANLVMTWSEPVIPVAGQVVNIYEVGTNTQIASVNVSGSNTDPDKKKTILQNSLFNTFLQYGKSYYAQFNTGLVKDSCMNSSTSFIPVTDKTSWVFTIENDPKPDYANCSMGTYSGNKFYPQDESYITNLTPTFKITFTEPVNPVANKKVDLYEETAGVGVAIKGNWYVTSMTPNGNRTEYTIPYSSITSLTGSLVDGKCYHINIEAGAFQEMSGVQTTPKLVSFVTETSGATTSCTWDFCVGDIIPPTITFWPLNKNENIPLNAYLFAQLSEPVQFDGEWAMTEVNAKNSFELLKLTGTSPDSTWQAINFNLEFVGTNSDKTRLMFTPLDPAAPDFGNTTNPTMDDDTWYKLRLKQPNGAGYYLQDAAGNNLVNNFTLFHTEDILCPVMTAGPTVTEIKADGFKLALSLDEAGSVDLKVVKKNAGSSGTALYSASITDVTAPFNYTFTVTGIDATTLNGYEYDVWITKRDNEIDRFATDAQILTQWPYTQTPSWGLETIRIKDLRPAPNVCSAEKITTVKLCDDDKPLITAYVPAWGAPSVDPTANITFTLNEPVILANSPSVEHDTLYIRDYENNLSIPAVVSKTWVKVSGKTYPQIVINPVNTLLDQHRYYIEIDRYAVRDSAVSCGKEIYLAELIGKNWWFKTKDNTKPAIVCESLSPTGSCVNRYADLVVKVYDGNLVETNPAEVPFIDIYEVGSSIPHERISTAGVVGVPDASGLYYTFTFPTTYFYLSGKCYTASIPAKLFKDSYGNKSDAPACSWSFCAEDYEAPVASWKVVEDFSYMYVARTDPYYEREYKHGDAGETLSDIPTSSFFYVKFQEPVMVLDTIGTDTWRALDSAASFNLDILANALKITNVTTGQELEYGPQYWILNDYYHPTDRFKVIITDDFSHIGYSGAQQWSGSYDYPFGSMMSNATYTIELKPGWISDMPSCSKRRIINDNVLLVTATTRNDVPPTLTVKDANGNVICDADCNQDWALTKWWSNMTQPNNWTDNCCGTQSDSVWWNWMPEWPGMNHDTICNICVAASDHITLEFDKAVVKTPVELINKEPFWWEGHGVQWWTEANLGLWPDGRDFVPTDPTKKSRFIKFQYFNGEGWEDADLARAEVIDNRIINLYWDSTLVSEGVYAITFAPYTVKDVIRVPDGNEFLGLTCTFKVVDHQKPAMISQEYIGDSTPSCVSHWEPYPTDIDTTAQLAMLFDEPVKPGKPGTKMIIRRENGQQQQIIDVSQITIDTREYLDADEEVPNPYYLRRVYVNNGNFEENTLYYVEVQPGFIADRAVCGSNYWDGIDPEDSKPGWQAYIPSFEWVFKTGDNTPPEPIQLIPNRQNDVARETDLTIIFDENVSASCSCGEPDYGFGGDMKSAPMTWNDYMVGKGFYIYADNGATPSVEFGNIVEFIPFYDPIHGINPRIKITGTDIYNGLTSNKVIIDPVTVFQRNMTYYVRVSDSIFCDGFMNIWNGIGDSTTWKFTITNDVAPEISWTSPAFSGMDDEDVTGDYPQTVAAMPNGYAITDLKMAFVDEDNHLPLNVKAGAGNIKIFEYIYNPLTFSYEEKLWKTIPISDPSVIFKGDTVIVKNVKLLDDINPNNCKSPRMYYVTVEPGAITNGYPGSMTYWVGFNDAFDWRFYTAPDNVFMMPYTIVKPLGTNLTIPAASTLQITFAENIEAVPETGKVKIYKKDGDVLVDQFDPVAANIVGNTLTLVTANLVDETEYYVVIENGAVGDTSTCSTLFPGFLDKTIWTFSTGDNTAPVPALATTLGNCEGTCVTVEFTFNETNGVTPGAGMIKLMKGSTVFASQPAVMGANLNTIKATFCNLPDTTVFTIAFDADVVKDNGNNHISNVATTNPAWTFKTADNTAPAIVEWKPVVNNAENSVTISVKANEKVDAVAGKKVTIVNGTANLVFDVSDMATADGGYTWTKFVDNLAEKTTYTVTVEAGAFKDKSCDPNPTEVATTWSFATDDNSKPIVSPYKPVQDEVLSTYRGLSISFTVSEPVVAGAGNITITRGTNVVSLPVTDPAKVVIDGTRITLVTPDLLYFGMVAVNVPAGAFMDMAITPNGNDSKTWTFWITDPGIAPNCMTIMSPVDGAEGVLKNTDLIMKFCEWMAPGDQTKLLKIYEILEVSGGLPVNTLFYSTPITQAMINHDLVTVPVKNMKDNTGYTVMIDYDAIRDEAGNKWEGINDPIKWNYRTGDNTAPTVVLVPATSSNNKNGFTVNAVFSEKVVGAKTAITVTGGTAVISTTDDIVFKIDVTANDGAIVVINVPVTITDVPDAKGYGNPLAAAVSGTYMVGDNTQPTVAITSQPADKTNTPRNFNVVLTFSEKVSGVAAALAGSTGMVGVTTTDDIVYTVAMSGADETQVKLILDKTLVKDVSENKNVLKDGVSETYTVGDWAAPTAVVNPAAKTDIRDAVFNVTVTFNEDVIVPATGGFVVTGGTLGAWTKAGNVYTLPITALDGANVKLELMSTIKDDSKNGNALAYAAYNYSFGDRTKPTVEVITPSAKDTVNLFNVVIRFSESVTGVDLTSVKLNGRKPKLVLSTIVPGVAYQATLSGADGDTLTLSLTDAIKDLAGNKLAPVSFVYTIADKNAPTVAANPPSGLNLPNKNSVELKFSENVVGVNTGVTITGATSYTVAMVRDSVYKVTFEAADLALVKIMVGSPITDWKGNAVVPATFMYEIGDHVAPTVVAVPATSTNAPNSWDVVITFSEPVNVPDGSITVTGAESYNINATTHTVSINAKDGAVVKLSLSAAIKDKSLNANPLVPVTFTYTVGDNTAPTVSYVGPVPANNTANSFNVTLTFSEEVTGVAAALAGSTGVTGVTPSADGKTYVVAMEGADLAKLRLLLDKTLVKDVSVNKTQLASGLDLAFTVGDHVAPTATVVPGSSDKAPNRWNVIITFSEAVNVPAGAITVTGGTGVVSNVGAVYTVAIEAADLSTVTLKLSNAIEDVSLNKNKYAGSEHVYKVGDNTPPTVKVIPPTASDTLNSFNVDIIFSEPVTGVNNTNVYLVGGTATNGLITLVEGLAYRKDVAGADNTTVKLVLSADIKDLAGNSLGKQEFTYTIGDHVAPTLLSATPASGTGNLKNETKVKLTFSEDVTGVPAAITVNKGTVVTTGSGAVYEAVITAPDMTTVILTIANTVADAAGNKFAGAVLNYTVGDNTAPKLVTWTPNGVTTEDNHPVFVMTFDEDVVAGTGSLYVYQEGVAGAFVTVPISASMVNGKTVTVAYDAKTNGALDKSTKYYVLVDNGALKDANGNKFAGVSDAKAWTFTTGPKFATSSKDLSSIEPKVYPNPFNGYLNVLNNDKLTRLTITNIAGQRVMDVVYPERVIRTENLVSGVYVITLFTQDGIAKSERIVKR